MAIPQYKDKVKEVKLFDTTLREGFQTPGAGASLGDRIEIVRKLRKVYGDDKAVIEIGMPANEVDWPIIKEIIEKEAGPQYCFLLRCHDLDVARAKEVFAQYKNNMAHLFVGVSKEHRDTRFGGGLDVDGYCELIKGKVKEVALDGNVKQIMFSPEDSTRAYWEAGGEVLMKIVGAALDGYKEGNIEVGRNEKLIVNLPDTIGIGLPSENMKMLREVKEKYSDIDLSVHFHNDMDCATGETLDSVALELVRYPQVCFSGTGERNGIGKAEPVIVGLNEREIISLSDEQAKAVTSVSRDIAGLMGIFLDVRYPVTGIDVNVSTAGIHAQTARRNKDTYHFMGEKYGNPVGIVFGSTSGKDTAKMFLEDKKYVFNDFQLDEYTNVMKEHANKIRHYLNETEMAVFAEKIINDVELNGFSVIDYGVTSRKSDGAAFIDLYIKKNGGMEVWKGEGVGAVDAVFNALSNGLGFESAKLVVFKPVVRGRGVKAELDVVVCVEFEGDEYWGRGVSDNVVTAPVDAVIDGFRNMYFLRNVGDSNDEGKGCPPDSNFGSSLESHSLTQCGGTKVIAHPVGEEVDNNKTGGVEGRDRGSVVGCDGGKKEGGLDIVKVGQVRGDMDVNEEMVGGQDEEAKGKIDRVKKDQGGSGDVGRDVGDVNRGEGGSKV